MTGTVEQLFELEETSFEKGCVITVRVLGKRALAPQRMHWMSAFLQTCMQPLNPMLHWPRPWIEAVNLCTRLSSRRSLGSPWLARHPTTTSTVMGANHFKWSVLVANSPSPMCASSLIPPLVLSLVTSTLSFWGILDPELISTGRLCLLMRIVGSGSSQLLRESTRFSLFKIILGLS